MDTDDNINQNLGKYEGASSKVEGRDLPVDQYEKQLITDYFKRNKLILYEKDRVKKSDKEILRERGYSILQKAIGRGAFGVVHRVRRENLINGSATEAAVKVLEMSTNYTKHLSDFKHEVFMFQLLKHENIIELYEAFLIDQQGYIVIEFATGGSLHKFVQNSGLKERRAKRYFFEIASAIRHMHQIGVAHRDIKLHNIMLCKPRSLKQQSLCKVTDFGLSRIMYTKNNGYHWGRTQCGTMAYMAPEILEKNELGDRHYNPMSPDIWALGVCLYTMLFRRHPFRDVESAKELLEQQQARKLKISQVLGESGNKVNISEDCLDLIFNLLELNPRKRITFNGILAHKWTNFKY